MTNGEVIGVRGLKIEARQFVGAVSYPCVVNALADFSPATRAWFEASFPSPTEAQERGLISEKDTGGIKFSWGDWKTYLEATF